MDDQAVDKVIENMEKDQSVSIETSDLALSKPNKLFLKLKISKKHICPVCSKEFTSGKALGGHIRIHMKGSKNGRHRKISQLQPRNIHRAKAKKRISQNMVLPKATDGAVDAVDLPLNDQEVNEQVSCCICNKGFRSMKSLFGHMRNHPERGWRGIRPPPSDKNSCCSSVSENDEAVEVDQINCATEKGLASGSDLLKSLPKWTNTAKRCGKLTFDENEVPEAAYCLMKLARGDSFDLGQSSVGFQRKYSPTDNPKTIDKTRSWGLANKTSSEDKKRSNIVLGKKMGEGKGKARLKTEWDQEKVASECKQGDIYSPDKKKKKGKVLAKELNCDKFIERKMMVGENKMKLTCADDRIIENNSWFDHFQKFPMKPNEEEGDPLTIEAGRYRGRISYSSQTPCFYPKNPSGGLFEAPLNETESPAEGKHLYSKTLFPKTANQAAEGSQVCSPKILDFDLNEPYAGLDDDEATGT
ncbi:uncharacterized protein LOC111284288 [Durio zibethinus]|uniref:Uncharacterized protein LOC111284288 n=1 Tax=Durio zibethinus TaxID=66656 RepID=A0A6P5XLH8_DURZI|nr:uncharacterized protein LOC111284288 [Durio zibethinus]